MVDPNKKYRLRNGAEYRLYATDGGGATPIHGAYKNSGGRWVLIDHMADGTFADHCAEHSFDLIPAMEVDAND